MDYIIEEGAEVGEGLKAGRGVIIMSGARVGCNAVLRDYTVVEPEVVLGDNIDTGYHVVFRIRAVVGHNVKVWSGTVIDPDAVIGDNARIHCNCYVCQLAILEADVFLAPGVVLTNDRYPVRTNPRDWEPPIIRRGARLGGGVIIGPGVEIGEYALIGAGGVVLKSVPSKQVWAGVPATRIR